MNTEYRIVPIIRYGTPDHYLQFKHTQSGLRRRWWIFGEKLPWSKSVWRYVPRANYVETLGYPAYQEDCPAYFPTPIWRYKEGWPYFLENWARAYPDIEAYFEHLRDIHAKYKKRTKESRDNAKIHYLSPARSSFTQGDAESKGAAR